jgi:hypothetical protein
MSVTSPLFTAVLLAATLTYLGSFAYLTTYLRRAYTATWVELGSFTLRDERRRTISGVFEWYIAGWRTLAFVLFGNQYRAAQDRRLTSLVWLVRVSFTVAIVLMLLVLISATGYHAPD